MLNTNSYYEATHFTIYSKTEFSQTSTFYPDDKHIFIRKYLFTSSFILLAIDGHFIGLYRCNIIITFAFKICIFKWYVSCKIKKKKSINLHFCKYLGFFLFFFFKKQIAYCITFIFWVPIFQIRKSKREKQPDKS